MVSQQLNSAGRPGRWLAFVLATVVLACLSACAPPARTLRVGTNDFPGYELLYLARDMDYFGSARIDVLEFPSATEVLRAYRNGAIDVAAVTADEALLVAEGNEAEHILLITDASAGADVILSNPRFPSMQSLRGRRIGAETGALGALVLSRALELNGLSADDVKVVPLTVDAHEAAYRHDLVDAVVTFDPVCDRLEAEGAVRVFDSTRMPREIFDVLIAPHSVFQERRKDLVALVRGWFRAQDHLRNQRADALRRMAARVNGRSVEEMALSLQRLEIPDRAKTLQWLGTGQDSLETRLESLSDFMIREELLPRRAVPRLLLDDLIVKDATS